MFEELFIASKMPEVFSSLRMASKEKNRIVALCYQEEMFMGKLCEGYGLTTNV